MAGDGDTTDVDGGAETLAGDAASASSRNEDSLLLAVAAAPPRRPPARQAAPSVLPPGTVVAETFRVETVLGRGAMGVVYVATDLALDRRVALKLHASPDDDANTSRMWREARAMARLAHPHVLTVHEVGLYQGRVYIAMELVAGGSVRDWLGDARSWRDVLDVFMQAAQGLAAAHRVGLVHRDFKPSNMLRDVDGRVRVADFGLARDGTDTADGGEIASITDDSRAVARTRTGVAVGTPAYMAPEQFGAGDVDHRADQFAFCVALHEALYGERPFEGETIVELHAAAALGRVRPPAPGRRVPGWLRAVVLRGLQPRPADRFADTSSLLAALRSDPTRRRRIVFAGVGIGAVAAATWGGLELDRARRRADCRTAADGVDEIWNAEAAGRLREAFVGSGAFLAESTFDHTTPILDAYADRWREGYAEACIAAEVEHARDVASWAAQRQCLDDRRSELGALVAVMSDAPDLGTIVQAVPAASGLGRVDACADDAWVARHPARNDDHRQALREAHWRARAFANTGRIDAGRAIVDELLAAVAESDVELRTAVLLLSAKLAAAEMRFPDTIRLCEEAFDLALAAGDDLLALEAAARLIHALASETELERGEFWARIASTLLRRVGDETLEGAYVHSVIAGLYLLQERYDDAEREITRGLEITESIVGPRHYEMAQRKGDLGQLHLEQGRYEEAQRELTEVLDLSRELMGPDHPNVAYAYLNLATLNKRLGHFDDAQREAEQAVAILEATFGHDHVTVGPALNLLAVVYDQQKRPKEAEQLYRRVIAIVERDRGPEHLHVGISRENLSDVLADQGQFEEAEREMMRAIAIIDGALGRGHSRAADARLQLGILYKKQGRYAEAEAVLQDVLAVMEKALPAGHEELGTVHRHLGDVYVQIGRFDEAAGEYEIARSIWEKALPDGHYYHEVLRKQVARMHEKQSEGRDAKP